MGLQVIDALESLHELGYIHSDLKPDNIMVGLVENNADVPEDENSMFKVYLIDFGLTQ